MAHKIGRKVFGNSPKPTISAAPMAGLGGGLFGAAGGSLKQAIGGGNQCPDPAPAPVEQATPMPAPAPAPEINSRPYLGGGIFGNRMPMPEPMQPMQPAPPPVSGGMFGYAPRPQRRPVMLPKGFFGGFRGLF